MILHRSFVGISILGGLIGTFFLTGVLINALGLNVTFYDAIWSELDGIYSTTVAVGEDMEFCLCPAYVCESSTEAAMLARPTIWGWRNFQYFRAPAFPKTEQSPRHKAENPKPIHALGEQEYCLMKREGDILSLTLSENAGAFWLDIK